MPEPQKPESTTNETLLDLSAGVVSSGGETLLDLDTSKGHASVIGKVEQLTGAQVASVNLSAATTRGSAKGEKSFTERVREGGAPLSRYEPLKELGRGGMGVVLRVRDADLRREVAMKVLRPDRSDTRSDQGKRDLRRFIEEAQITGQLEHPGIVPVHELGCDAQGRVFFTMKMVRGEPLSEVLRRLRLGDTETIKAWPLDRLLGVFLKICEALNFAHAHTVVHRDMKPANIMIGAFGEVLVMDWGLARVLDAQSTDSLVVSIQTDSTERRNAAQNANPEFTMDGSVVGTPAYMAPEQAKGQLAKIDARTDIFALGAILYEMLCLRPPYEGSDATQMIESAAAADIRTPLARAAKDPTIRYRMAHLPGSKIPRELDAVCMKALSAEQIDRYQDVRQLKNDVENFIAGRPVSVRRDSIAVQAAKWVRRHPTLAASGAAAVVVILVAAAVIGLLTADANMRQAESDRIAMDETKSRMQAQHEAMDAMTKQSEAEKEAMAAVKEKVKAEAKAKDEAMAREAALKRRAEATVQYNMGRNQASRVRLISEKRLREAAGAAAEGRFLAALEIDPSMAEAAFELGNVYHEFNKREAIEYYVKADKLQREAGGKGDPRALVYAGDATREITGDFDAASRLYEQAAAIDPDDVYAIIGFGFVALLSDRFDIALMRAGKAQTADTTLWEPWHLEGEVHAREFDSAGVKSNDFYSPQGAIHAFTEAIARCLNGGMLYNERGTAYLALGQLEEAERDLLRAHELMPYSYAPQNNLVVLYQRQKRIDDALKLSAETLNEFPDAYEMWNEYANCLYAKGFLNDAYEAVEKSLALKPGRIVPICNASNIARQMGEFDKALEWAQKAVAANAQYGMAWFQLGMAQRSLKKYDDALASFKRAVELESANTTFASEYFLQLGICGKLDEMKAACEAFVASYPDEATGHHWLGRALRSLRRIPDALVEFKKACELAPSWEEPFEQSVGLLFELERHDDAAKLARERVEKDPKFRLGWFVLGVVESTKGNPKGAYENFNKAVEADENYARALICLAEVANQIMLYQQAFNAATRYTNLQPKDANGFLQRAKAAEGNEDWEEAIRNFEVVDRLQGGKGSTKADVERVNRRKRVSVIRAENRQPKDATECYDLLFLEAYYGRWQTACTWGRKLFNEYGKEIKDREIIYFCAWIEMKALQALDLKLVEKPPENPKPAALETNPEGYKQHCLLVLKRLLELGFDAEELKLDSNFNSLHQLEGWTKLFK